MFNWTTTTILNTLKDFTTGDALINVNEDTKILKIKRDFTFEPRYITKVYKAEAQEAKLCKMTVDLASLVGQVGDYRLTFYITLEGSNESIYANDMIQKGKAFSIGFHVSASDTAKRIAEKIKANADKFGVVMYGKKIFVLTATENGKLEIAGTHEYQRFRDVAIAKSVNDGLSEELVLVYTYGDDANNDEAFVLNERGENSFGTYLNLIKDLRLPTVHNTKWLKVKADETPAVGALYNQYIINYCAPSMANPGLTVVGQTNMSTTTHVFWVNQTVASEFEAALAQAGIDVTTVSYVDNGVQEASTGAGSTPAVTSTKNRTAGPDKVLGTKDDVITKN